MSTGLDPIGRRRVAEGVQEALTEVIRSGRLSPGQRLPSERHLCEQLQVARTTVREAMHGLATLGLIERRGNGSFVVERLPGVDFSDDLRKRQVSDLFEVRRVVEVPIAQFATTRATDEERQRIVTLGDSFDTNMPLDLFRRRDREFHAAIAQASKNPALAEFYAKLLDTLFKSTEFESLLTADHNECVVRRIIAEAVVAHREIAGQIAARNVDLATKATEEHLNQVEALMVAQLT